MKRTAIGILTAVWLFGSALLAQDLVALAPQGKKVVLDNEHVRVIEVTLAPGAKEPVHTHPANFAYVMNDGRVRVSYVGGKSQDLDAKCGDVVWSDPEPPHTLQNLTQRKIKFLLVELKDLPYSPSAQTAKSAH